MVEKKDMYGYELVEAVSKIVDVNEGTITAKKTGTAYLTVTSNDGKTRTNYETYFTRIAICVGSCCC